MVGWTGSASISVKPENLNVPRSSADKVPSCAAGDFRISGPVLQNTLSLCTGYHAKRSFYRFEKSKKHPLLYWHQRTPGIFIFNSVR
jgi:hypothetical protein